MHVEDVCQAFLVASDAAPGVYDIGTGTTFSPHELALALTGSPLPDYAEFPNCAPQYVNEPLPNWRPRMDVLWYARSHTRQAA